MTRTIVLLPVLALLLAGCMEGTGAPVVDRTIEIAIVEAQSAAEDPAPAPAPETESVEVQIDEAAEAAALTAELPGFEAVESGPRVALLLPLSDSRPAARELAEAMERAARLAVMDLGRGALQLKAYDTAGPDGAAAAAEQAVADEAELILGPLFAKSVSAVEAVARREGVNVIAFSTNSAVAGPPVYLMGSLPQQEFERVIQHAVAKGHRSISALVPDTPYGDLAVASLDLMAFELGVRVPIVERYPQTFEGAKAVVEIYAARRGVLKAKDPESLATAILLPESGKLLQTLAAFLSVQEFGEDQLQLLGSGVWDSEDALREDALRGGWFAAPDPRLRPTFAARYASQFGASPPALASLAYDAVAVAGTLAGAMVENAFAAEHITDPNGFAGVGGAYRFNESGLNQRTLAVLEVGEDEFEVADPAPLRFPES